jgi:hypothetical protein
MASLPVAFEQTKAQHLRVGPLTRGTLPGRAQFSTALQCVAGGLVGSGMGACLAQVAYVGGQDLTGPNLTGQTANVSFPGSRQAVRTSRVRITQGLTAFAGLAVTKASRR